MGVPTVDEKPGPPRPSALRRLLDSAPVRYLREAREKDLGTHLLAISAQQLLCTVPLAVALGAVAKRMTGVSFSSVITNVLDLDPKAHQEIVAALAGSPHVSTVALLINLGFSVAFGVGVAATLQRGLELIWQLPRGPYVGSTVRNVLWALALPVLIGAVVLLGRGGHILGRHINIGVATGFVLQVLLIATFIWATQYLLLSGRVAARHLLLPTALGTLAIAVVVLIARQMISGQIVPAYRAYGSVGIGIVLSAWVAIASSATSIALALGCWFGGRRHKVATQETTAG